MFKWCFVVNVSFVVNWSSVVNLSFCDQLILCGQQNIFVVNFSWSIDNLWSTCHIIICGTLNNLWATYNLCSNDHLWSTERLWSSVFNWLLSTKPKPILRMSIANTFKTKGKNSKNQSRKTSFLLTQFDIKYCMIHYYNSDMIPLAWFFRHFVYFYFHWDF